MATAMATLPMAATTAMLTTWARERLSPALWLRPGLMPTMAMAMGVSATMDTATTPPMAMATATTLPMAMATATTTWARGMLSLLPRPLLTLTMATMAMEDTDMATDTAMEDTEDTMAMDTLPMGTMDTTSVKLLKLPRVEDLFISEI